jgi:hypothetical protein
MTIKEIESAVKDLSAEELASFRQWYADFDAEEWNRQIEADAYTGKLDRLGDQALADHKAGLTKEL